MRNNSSSKTIKTIGIDLSVRINSVVYKFSLDRIFVTMNMHKNVRLTPHDRKEVWGLWQTGAWKKVKLSERFRVSRPTIAKVLNRARKQEFSPRNSSNHRFNSIKFGIKRLAKVEGVLERKRKAEARRYNKSYPGEMIHFDTKRLPLLKGENNTMPREYLFVAIDDYSRELYATFLNLPIKLFLATRGGPYMSPINMAEIAGGTGMDISPEERVL